jgi:hypothetical protein
MTKLLEYPVAVFLGSAVLQYLAACLGYLFRKNRKWPNPDNQSELATIVGAALTLLALIIGFSFSMAVGRYDQRKTYEEAEANAIGTEYVRADLLAATSASQVRDLLTQYAGQRILFYEERNQDRLRQIDAETARLQEKLWSAVTGPATAQPTPVAALAVSGMNDVLNSQGYTQAAWWNRIPPSAWTLMLVVALACNLLIGAGEEHRNRAALAVLPLIVSISMFLIADIDSPRRGVILVAPQNLIALSHSLGSH